MNPTPVLDIIGLIATAIIAIVALTGIFLAMRAIVQNKANHRPERKP